MNTYSMTIRHIITLLLYLFFTGALYSQGSELPASLLKKLSEAHTQADSVAICNKAISAQLTKNLDVGDAIRVYAENLASESGDSALIYDVRFREALLKRNRRNHTDALILLEQCIVFEKEENDQARLHHLYKVAGDIYSRDGVQDKADLYIGKAIEYYQDTDNLELLAQTQRTMGSNHRRQGRPDLAIALYHRALDNFKALDDSAAIGTVHNSLGLLYHSIQQNEKANEHYHRSLIIAQDQGNIYRQLSAYNGLAITESDATLKENYHLEALDRANKLGNPVRIAHVNFNLAQYYVEQSQRQKALLHLERSVEAYAQAQRTPNIEVRRLLVQLYIEDGNISEARELLAVLEEQIKTVPSLDVRTATHMNMATYYANLQDYERALYHQDLYTTYSDSLINIEKNKAIAELETKYEVKEKDQRITTLNLEKKLSDAKLRTQFLLLIAAISLITVLSFLFYRLRKQKRVIDKQDREKAVLLKEIHHRVKNNLQIISSLLRLQTSQTDDPAAVDALTDGQARVYSMSLIHQNLYQHDDLSKIHMPQYMEKLVSNLFQAYNVSPERISLSIDIDEVEMDVDNVVPLGLTTNELVTNSLKYAFPDERHGNITVALKDTGDTVTLSVADDGVGIDLESIDESSFGRGLVEAFVEKLQGSSQTIVDDGTRVEIIIPKDKLI